MGNQRPTDERLNQKNHGATTAGGRMQARKGCQNLARKGKSGEEHS